jgi:hypothetical protein
VTGRRPRAWPPRATAVLALGLGVLALLAGLPSPLALAGTPPPRSVARWGTSGAVANFSAAIGRLVELLGVAGGGLLSIVWARVALSWFSNDLAKKVQAKDRARDALIGTLLFTAAVSGLFWGLSQWVLTGA